MDGDPFVTSAVARLRRAGLFDVVERAAKRNGVLAKHVLAPGDVTGGHRAAWQALRGQQRNVENIAALVGFPVAVVAQGLAEEVSGDAAPAPVAAPPKPPAKEPRPKAPPKAPKPTKAPRAVALPEVPDLEVPDPPPPPQRLIDGPDLDVSDLRHQPMGVASVPLIGLALARSEGVMSELRSAADGHQVPVEMLVSRKGGAVVALARVEAAWRMRFVRGLSLAKITKILGRRDQTTVAEHLAKFQPTPELLALVPQREAA